MFIEEYFEVLFEQKNKFYLINNDLEPCLIEQSYIDKIINPYDHPFPIPENDKKPKLDYHLDRIYYGLDGKNIFKRVDRYRHKKYLIPIFILLILINLHEIIFNIVLLSNGIGPEDLIINGNENYDRWDIASEYLCDIYIFIILMLTAYTFYKFDIETKIYY